MRCEYNKYLPVPYTPYRDLTKTAFKEKLKQLGYIMPSEHLKLDGYELYLVRHASNYLNLLGERI